MTVTGKVTMSVPRTTVRASPDHARRHVGERQDRVGGGGRCRPCASTSPAVAAQTARARGRRLIGDAVAAAGVRVTANQVSRRPSDARSVVPVKVV